MMKDLEKLGQKIDENVEGKSSYFVMKVMKKYLENFKISKRRVIYVMITHGILDFLENVSTKENIQGFSKNQLKAELHH